MSTARHATLRINPIACEAHGLCAELLPELIRLDDWGYPIIEDPIVPADLIDEVRLAIEACPVLALRTELRRREASAPGRKAG